MKNTAKATMSPKAIPKDETMCEIPDPDIKKQLTDDWERLQSEAKFKSELVIKLDTPIRMAPVQGASGRIVFFMRRANQVLLNLKAKALLELKRSLPAEWGILRKYRQCRFLWWDDLAILCMKDRRISRMIKKRVLKRLKNEPFDKETIAKGFLYEIVESIVEKCDVWLENKVVEVSPGEWYFKPPEKTSPDFADSPKPALNWAVFIRGETRELGRIANEEWLNVLRTAGEKKRPKVKTEVTDDNTNCDPNQDRREFRREQAIGNDKVQDQLQRIQCDRLVDEDDSGDFFFLAKQKLANAIASLPEDQRTVIELRFFRGLTQKAIAEKLEFSRKQVYRIERSAKEQLRCLLGSQNDLSL
jgi:RNA polymerase sigma factor (sigma-70 family)